MNTVSTKDVLSLLNACREELELLLERREYERAASCAEAIAYFAKFLDGQLEARYKVELAWKNTIVH